MQICWVCNVTTWVVLEFPMGLRALGLGFNGRSAKDLTTNTFGI